MFRYILFYFILFFYQTHHKNLLKSLTQASTNLTLKSVLTLKKTS